MWILMEKKSRVAPLHVRVAQGSLLAVLIFQLFINDLPSVLHHSMSILYADDTTVFVIGRSLRFLRLKMQKDLDHLCEWLCVNRLNLNTSKTKVLLFNRENLKPNIVLKIGNQKLEVVDTFKFLGIVVNTNLSFINHYEFVYHKLARATYIVRTLARILPLYVIKSLYYAYYHSHLQYGILIWYPLLNVKYQNSIYALQKHLIRCLCNSGYTEYCMPLFKRESILVPKHHLQIVNRSFLCKPISDWQQLSTKLKTCTSKPQFVKSLKKVFVDKY